MISTIADIINHGVRQNDYSNTHQDMQQNHPEKWQK